MPTKLVLPLLFILQDESGATVQEPIQAPPTEYGLGRTVESVETERHDYVYASGRLLREVITTTDAEGNATTEVLDFTYDVSTGYHNGGFVYYNSGSLKWYKNNICPYDGATEAMILAHELIHAHRANCEGLNLDDYQEYNGIYGCSLEEIYTCGFDMLQYPSQYSENLLRLEHGLPLRTMYEREAYFSALRRNAYAQDYMV